MKVIETTVELSLVDAEAAVRRALRENGFGVLTEIDVAATLKEKLGVDRPPLKILGACNPDFANRALTIDPEVSLLLPCNVVLETVDGGTHVATVDPAEVMPGEALGQVAGEAAARLRAVIDAVQGS